MSMREDLNSYVEFLKFFQEKLYNGDETEKDVYYLVKEKNCTIKTGNIKILESDYVLEESNLNLMYSYAFTNNAAYYMTKDPVLKKYKSHRGHRYFTRIFKSEYTDREICVLVNNYHSIIVFLNFESASHIITEESDEEELLNEENKIKEIFISKEDMELLYSGILTFSDIFGYNNNENDLILSKLILKDFLYNTYLDKLSISNTDINDIYDFNEYSIIKQEKDLISIRLDNVFHGEREIVLISDDENYVSQLALDITI